MSILKLANDNLQDKAYKLQTSDSLELLLEVRELTKSLINNYPHCSNNLQLAVNNKFYFIVDSSEGPERLLPGKAHHVVTKDVQAAN